MKKVLIWDYYPPKKYWMTSGIFHILYFLCAGNKSIETTTHDRYSKDSKLYLEANY